MAVSQQRPYSIPTAGEMTLGSTMLGDHVPGEETMFDVYHEAWTC